MRHDPSSVLPALALCACLGGLPSTLGAQTDVEALGRLRGGATPPPGYYETLRRLPHAFRFWPDGGWLRRARAISARRAVMRAEGGGGTLAAPEGAHVGEDGVLRGSLAVPVFLILYQNTDSARTVTNLPRDSMEDRIYGTHEAPPYSIHSYYREISRDRLLVTGVVLDWTRVSEPDTIYEGDANGLDATGDMPGLIREIVALHDPVLDFGAFDNDGPDGVPNSGDDDGYVDAIVLFHPEVGGECKRVNAAAEKNIWAHKFSYRGWTGTDLETDDPAANGGRIKIRDYIIQGGQGGDGGCTSDKPQAMGVVAHETGHIFGLPDLYDTGGSTRGIGWWGIMGSGNQNVPTSPAHMEAWSRAELGWVTEVVIERDTVLDVSPIAAADTAYVLPIPGTDEYFLLENRQRLGSDAGMAGPGLLVWHADSALINERRLFNRVNASLPHGLALEQADGRGDLENRANSGDAGDPYPGSASVTTFGHTSTPSSTRNDGSPTCIVVDEVAQGEANGAMQLRVTFPANEPLRIDGGEPAPGKMGVHYEHRFRASGGTCVQAWEVAAGAPPPGLALSAGGLLAGRPETSGDFVFDVRVVSDTLAATETVHFSVTAPALEADAVLRHLVGVEQLLSADDIAYLDIIGNRNFVLDVGDFFAWILQTGGSASAEAIPQVLEGARDAGRGAQERRP